MRYRLMTLIAALAVLAGQPAASAELATYEARYNLVLEELNIPGSVKSWKGGAAVRVARDCQKWTIRVEVAFTLLLVDGRVFKTHSVEKYFESLDGKRLEFDVVHKANGSVRDHKKGVVVLQAKGKPGRATYSNPRGKTMDLPAGTELPMAATATIVANLAKGKTAWRQFLFMSGDLVTMSYSVEEKGVPLKKQPKGDTRLTKFSGWRVSSTARFVESGLNFTFESLVHPNGLASQNLYQHEMVSFRDKLVEIRALPAPEC